MSKFGELLGKHRPIKTLKLFEEFTRKLGTQKHWLIAARNQTTANDLEARKQILTDLFDSYSTWTLTPNGKAYTAWEINENGAPPNGGPAEAGVTKPNSYQRTEETSLAHRITAAHLQETKCKVLFDWLADQLDVSWSAQKNAIADNNDNLSIYAQLQQLVRDIVTLGLGNAAVVSAELKRKLHDLHSANNPSEVVSRLEKIEEVYELLKSHRALVTSTIDEAATAEAVAHMPPAVADGGAVNLPVIYKSCPDLPDRDELYNLLLSLVETSSANTLITVAMEGMELTTSWDVIKARVKRIEATSAHKKQRTGEQQAASGQNHAMFADHGDLSRDLMQQQQAQQAIACAVQQQQVSQLQDIDMHQQYQQQVQQQQVQHQAQQQAQQQQPVYLMQHQQGYFQQPTLAFAAQAQSRQPVYGMTSKPGICYAHQRGECNRGSNCRFSHDLATVGGTGTPSATDSTTADACTFHRKGTCIHGDNCRFRHESGAQQQRLPGTLGAHFRGAGVGGM